MSLSRRRKYLISGLQVRLLLLLGIYGLVFVLLVGGVVFLPVILDMADSELSASQHAKAGEIFLALDLRLWPAVLLTLLAIGWHSVLVTHRIVGPLYRLRQVMGAAAGGDHAIVARIRKKDLLHDETASLNELLRSVESRWDAVREDALRLSVALKNAAPDGGPSTSDVQDSSWRVCLLQLESHFGSPPRKTPEPPPALPSSARAPEIHARDREGRST